jgi:hypothetical protein
VTALFAGLTYANIHDAQFPDGEIRGQLTQTPEPNTLMLLGMVDLPLGESGARPEAAETAIDCAVHLPSPISPCKNSSLC